MATRLLCAAVVWLCSVRHDGASPAQLLPHHQLQLLPVGHADVCDRGRPGVPGKAHHQAVSGELHAHLERGSYGRAECAGDSGRECAPALSVRGRRVERPERGVRTRVQTAQDQGQPELVCVRGPPRPVYLPGVLELLGRPVPQLGAAHTRLKLGTAHALSGRETVSGAGANGDASAGRQQHARQVQAIHRRKK